MRRVISRWAVVLLCAALAPTPAFARKGQVPEGFLFGLTAPVSDVDKEPDADNIGAPRAVLAALYRKTGANLGGLGYAWRECEPSDPGDGPSRYVWPDRGGDPFVQVPGLQKMVGFDLTTPAWAVELEKQKKAKDPAAMKRYWALVERFVTAASRQAREKYRARYFHVPGNESSLASCTDHPIYEPEYDSWSTWYMDTAKHVYNAVKADNPANQVVIGSLVVGDRGHVGALYGAGAKGHFDVIDIHAYGDAKTHVSMNQIVETHQVLEEHGDGDKKIYLGEGWSCFPLPRALDGNLDKAVQYTPEHVDHYWETIQIGWMNLTTPRPGEYDPKWVLGANYFTFCDLIEGRGWRKRAVPQRDKDGKIKHYLVDGYKKTENELGPFFRPWGIVDIEGKPKGDILDRLPPYIPKYQFLIRFSGLDTSGNVNPGRSYTVSLMFASQEDETMLDARLGIYFRGPDGGQTGEVKIETISSKSAARLGKDERVVARYRVVFPEQFSGKECRAYGECRYRFDGKPYYADAWGPRLRVR